MGMEKIVNFALFEDKTKQDATTNALVPKDKKLKANILVKENGIICGLGLIKKIFGRLDKKSHVQLKAKDGQKVKKGKVVAEVYGSARSIIASERIVLNFLQHLSGIASLTAKYVEKTKGTKTKIYDTRKTVPGLRELAKYAVKCGGGVNHRMNLGGMAMIKDNHLKVVVNIPEAVKKIRRNKRNIKVEVECDNISQVKQALKSRADIIMLDNMNIKTLKKAIKMIRGNGEYKPLIEISGGITLDSIRKLSKLNADRISIGALTHSAPALDISMEIN